MKCALITGGSRGIGRAICVKLGSLGYHILINFRSNLLEAETNSVAYQSKKWNRGTASF
ncbi:MAG: SDR family NAD(P)-dependent oxidoreductase [Puia sp.]